jgi:hypothetical protein
MRGLVTTPFTASRLTKMPCVLLMHLLTRVRRGRKSPLPIAAVMEYPGSNCDLCINPWLGSWIHWATQRRPKEKVCRAQEGRGLGVVLFARRPI